MSDSVSPTQLTQSQASSLAAGITGLFIQGIESGVVLAQFSWWLSAHDHRERYLVSVIVVFVTAVGLTQSGLYFASAWTTYVQQFGIPPCVHWEDDAQIIPTLFTSVPVQALMIRRCYYLGGKNLFIITPVVLLLVASIVMSLWSIVLLVNYLTVVSVTEPLPSLHWISISVSWPYLMSVLLTSVLDIILTGIMFYYLSRTKKQVYTAQTRKRLSRLTNIVWQSALPPTLCAICLSVLYIRFSIVDDNQPQLWLTVLQAMIGKLYVLSLFYIINGQRLQLPDERPTMFPSTLTAPPMETMNSHTRNARVGGDACSEMAIADYGHEKTIVYAV